MKLIHLTWIFTLTTLLTIGCSSDADEDCVKGPLQLPNAVGPIDGAQYQASLLDCREPRIQNFRASNLTGSVITGAQGTTIFVNPQSFEQNGIFIDGDVEVELIEMYRPGEIIACQLSTNGINLSGTIEPLFSESIFYLNITYEGAAVTFLQPLRVFAPSENLGEQQFLYASPSCPQLECTVLWEEVISTVPVFEKPIEGPTGEPIFGYQALVQDIGWKNIGRYNEDASPRTTVYNKAPTGYNDTNGNVFICYDTASTAIGLYSDYDTNLEVFTEQYAQIPTGLMTDVIFVTVQNNQYLYGTKRGMVAPDFLTATLETTSTDETGMINALNNL